MSIDYTTYVGPYVECRMEKKDGADLIDRDKVYDLLDGTLFNPLGDDFHIWMRKHNVHLWLANLKIPGQKRDFTFYPDQAIQYLPIDPQLMNEEVARFSEFYKRELSTLWEKYGAGNVQVKWGLIHYIH